MFKIKPLLFFVFMILTSAFLVTGCGDDDSTGPIDDSINPPSDVKVVIDATEIGGSIAQITWTSSTSEANSNFRGYVVITDTTTVDGTTLGRVDSTFLNKSESDFKNISNLERGKYYQTRIYSLGNDGRNSNTVESIVYAGVYARSGVIDEYSPAYNTAQSGYAWETLFFGGSKLSFTSANFNFIDLHLRVMSGKLSFVSPKLVEPAARQTFYEELAGTAEAAFDKAEDLPEPTKTQIEIKVDKVYLLKTQDNYYIKIWVKEINQGDFKTVNFDYKVQPISGFRVLKN